jgi:hypothetical protein
MLDREDNTLLAEGLAEKFHQQKQLASGNQTQIIVRISTST